MVDTGIAIFAYNRSRHLKKVLDGLKKNELHHKVYIFQDREEGRDLTEWNLVKDVITAIDWMEFEYIINEKRKGCAKSIEDGIGYVLERHAAVIVIEDDCVPHPVFLKYMDLCLEKYQKNGKVIGIGGFAHMETDEEKLEEDVYATGRTSSWGWGTWKDRWEGYCRDYEILRRIYADQEASRRLGIWGDDLEDMLCSTLVCKADAWDIFWSLHAIEKDMVFILPFKSLIQNIGMDGSGTNCETTDKFEVECYEEEKNAFRLIEDCNTSLEIEMAFAPVFNGYGHQYAYKKEGYKKAVVWGAGRYYRKNKKEFLKDYDVQAFIDRRKIRYFEGKPVIDCTMLENYEYDVIVIMFVNKEEAKRMKKKLTGDYRIPEDKITIWID